MWACGTFRDLIASSLLSVLPVFRYFLHAFFLLVRRRGSTGDLFGDRARNTGIDSMIASLCSLPRVLGFRVWVQAEDVEHEIAHVVVMLMVSKWT